jgi:DNA ligase 1
MKATWVLRLCSGDGGAIGGRSVLLLRAATSIAKKPKRKSPRRLQRPLKRTSSDRASRHRHMNTVVTALTPAPPSAAALSLAEFHPAIARTWIAAASNKMLQPQHVSPASRKLAWWICPSCQHQYNKRIDLHLAAGGACPKCQAKPSLTPPTPVKKSSASPRRGFRGGTAKGTAPSSLMAPVAAIAHKCRPQSSQASLAVDNANMLSKSVADDHYLRVQETRNLLPMLAKNFDNERDKISPAEVVHVSPKLDGIRCVVAYRADTRQVLFFSRSGTLFECCDDAIEPAVRHLFEKDPTLVLDGELYNDSVNLAQLAALQKGRPKANTSLSSSNPTSAFYATLLAAAPGSLGKDGRASATASGAAAELTVIRFEQLTSAIRTTRQRLTPAVAALQRQLQYHVFDVLYASEFPNGSAATVPFSVRYAFLEKLLAAAAEFNASHIPNYNPLVLRRVPNYSCTLDVVDEVLRAAMRVGYEGVMIRREGKGKSHQTSRTGRNITLSPLQPAKAKLKRAAGDDASGGYGFGQRSSTLLKYKVMQDAEYIIVGAVEGSGKWKGSLGSFICVTEDQKQRFTVTPASTDAEKKRMWRTWRHAYKGKALTVQYQELTPDGVPRFPVGKSVRGAADGHDWL